MKRNFLSLFLLGVIALVLLTFTVAGQELESSRQQKLKYGPSLYILDVTSLPPEIQPGSNGNITIELKNVAPHQLRDIIIELELPAQFAPKDITKKKIRKMEGEEALSHIFEVTALPNSAEGVYKVPLKISYLDEIGSEYKENNTISLKISVEPKVFLGLASSSIYEGNLLGKVDLRIANTGVGGIKFLVAELLPSKGYKVVGPSNEYIGKLESDDYETVDFKIEVEEGSSSINLLANLDYTDNNNKQYSKRFDIQLNIISAKEAGIKQNKNSFYVYVIIGAVILFLVYRQFKKRLRKHPNRAK